MIRRRRREEEEEEEEEGKSSRIYLIIAAESCRCFFGEGVGWVNAVEKEEEEEEEEEKAEVELRGCYYLFLRFAEDGGASDISSRVKSGNQKREWETARIHFFVDFRREKKKGIPRDGGEEEGGGRGRGERIHGIGDVTRYVDFLDNI